MGGWVHATVAVRWLVAAMACGGLAGCASSDHTESDGAGHASARASSASGAATGSATAQPSGRSTAPAAATGSIPGWTLVYKHRQSGVTETLKVSAANDGRFAISTPTNPFAFRGDPREGTYVCSARTTCTSAKYELTTIELDTYFKPRGKDTIFGALSGVRRAPARTVGGVPSACITGTLLAPPQGELCTADQDGFLTVANFATEGWQLLSARRGTEPSDFTAPPTTAR